jgi:alpha-L-fucosidase
VRNRRTQRRTPGRSALLPDELALPRYYDVTGTNCPPNKWGYTTDPAHKENARIMKSEVYQQVKELMTQYGKVDDIYWGDGWPGQHGPDADAVFFWEPGKLRDSANQWPVDAVYSEECNLTTGH